MSLIEKVNSLEFELSVAREQLDWTSTSKLYNMLNVQKSFSDKIGLGFVESVSTFVVHPPKFVPAVEKEKFPTYHKLTHHTIKSTKYSQLQSTTYCC